jgi:hypothetical protein
MSRADNLDLGASSSWKPQCLSRLYRDCFTFITNISVSGISKYPEGKKISLLKREQK